MRERIQALEKDARRLDPDAAQRERWREVANAYAERFLERLGEPPNSLPDVCR